MNNKTLVALLRADKEKQQWNRNAELLTEAADTIEALLAQQAVLIKQQLRPIKPAVVVKPPKESVLKRLAKIHKYAVKSAKPQKDGVPYVI